MFQGGVGGQDRVVGLNDRSGDLWCGINCELQLGLFAVVNAETLHQKGGKSTSGTATEAVKYQKALETSTLIGQFPNSVKDKVDNFLADGVVTSGVVVGSIFLAGNQLLGVEQLPIGTSADLVCKRIAKCTLYNCLKKVEISSALKLSEKTGMCFHFGQNS